jgi:putative zinc finger protein
MTNPTEHIPGAKLSELLDGMLSETERLAVEAHLADCAECRCERDALSVVIASLAALPTERVGDGFRQGVMERIGAAQATPTPQVIPLRRYMTRALPIAATLLVAVGLGLAILGDPGQPKSAPSDLTASRAKNIRRTDLDPSRGLPRNKDEENGLEHEDASDAMGGAAGSAEGALKPLESTPEAALMSEALAACAQEAFGGVHQTLTMEADDPDALAQRAVAVAAGLGVNATIVPSAKKPGGKGGDIRVRLTVPRAQYEALLKKLAGLTPVQRRQVLENAVEPEDKLLARAPAQYGEMRKAKGGLAAPGGAMTMRAPRMTVAADAMQHEPPPAAPEARGGRIDESKDAVPAAPGVSLAVDNAEADDAEPAWITLIIRVVPVLTPGAAE